MILEYTVHLDSQRSSKEHRSTHICRVCSELHGETYVTIRRSNSLLFIQPLLVTFCQKVARREKSENVSPTNFGRFPFRNLGLSIFNQHYRSSYSYYLRTFIVTTPVVFTFHSTKRF